MSNPISRALGLDSGQRGAGPRGAIGRAPVREITIYGSEARTAAPILRDLEGFGARGVHIVIDVTAVGVTPSVTFEIRGKDPTSGKYYTILASAAIAAVGTTVLKVFPGATAAANSVANDCLPETWRVVPVHGNAITITYSVGAILHA